MPLYWDLEVHLSFGYGLGGWRHTPGVEVVKHHEI